MPGSNGPKPAWYFAFDAVRLTAPYVRPWKPPRNPTMYGRPVEWRASFIAASTTSAPELPRYVRSLPCIGAIRAMAAAVSA